MAWSYPFNGQTTSVRDATWAVLKARNHLSDTLPAYMLMHETPICVLR
jgi:hypothetical protein